MQALNSFWMIIAFSVIVILSFLFNILSKKTNIPSVLMLILMGFLIKEGLSAVDVKIPDLKQMLEIIGVVGLIMIVLEAALDLKLKKDKTILILKAFFISLVLLLATSLVIAYIFQFFIQMDLFTAMIYAVPLSIMSSAIIIPSVANLTEENKEFMIYEATFSDILGIMLFYFLLDTQGIESGKQIAVNVTSNIGLTIVASVLLSYLLVFLFQYIKQMHGRLFLMVAVLTLLYSVGKLFHLSSLLIILTFGLVLNNRRLFIRGVLKKIIKAEDFKVIFKDFKTLIEESSFVIRTFFFVLFGLTIHFDSLGGIFIYAITILILLVLYGIRYLNLKIVTKDKVMPLLFIAPRGLITILLFYAIPQELIDPYFDSNILLFVILSTNVIMMIALMRSGGDYEEVDKMNFGSLEREVEFNTLNKPVKPTE